MRTIALLLTVICISTASYAQVAPNKYFIAFTDKENSPFSVDRPLEFLSVKSVERRNRQGIAVVSNDIPVKTDYCHVNYHMTDKVFSV